MTSPRVTLPEEEEGADRDGVERNGAEREGGAAKSDYLAQKCASLRLTVA